VTELFLSAFSSFEIAFRFTAQLRKCALILRFASRTMADQERMTAEFMELTNADAERSKFYLESSGWDVQVKALSIF
jgi:UBA-like domain